MNEETSSTQNKVFNPLISFGERSRDFEQDIQGRNLSTERTGRVLKIYDGEIYPVLTAL